MNYNLSFIKSTLSIIYYGIGLGVLCPDTAHVVAPYFGFVNVHVIVDICYNKFTMLNLLFYFLLFQLPEEVFDSEFPWKGGLSNRMLL